MHGHEPSPQIFAQYGIIALVVGIILLALVLWLPLRLVS